MSYLVKPVISSHWKERCHNILSVLQITDLFVLSELLQSFMVGPNDSIHVSLVDVIFDLSKNPLSLVVKGGKISRADS